MRFLVIEIINEMYVFSLIILYIYIYVYMEKYCYNNTILYVT